MAVGGLGGGAGGLLAASHALPHTGAAAPLLFVLGLLVGGAASTLLLTAVTALTGGLSVVYASVGVGRWLGSVRVGGVLVVFRLLLAVPFNACVIAVDRPGLRLRVWSGIAGSTVLTAAGAAALVLSGDTALAALGWGAALLVLLVLLTGWNRPMSRGWALWRLPTRAGGEAVREWANDPASLRAARLLSTGRIAAARAELAAAPADGGPRRTAVAASVAVAAGRFDEGARAAMASAAASRAPQLRAGALGAYAIALGSGVATRLWTPEQVRAGFHAAVEEIRNVQPVLLQATALGALESMFAGDLKEALRRSTRAASLAPDRFSRAQAFAVQAVALRAAGHPDEAAKVLDRARRLAPDAELLAPAR
ncbi:hypothetical protein [Actinacidiphila yeochonensis]|uniref:hypothetical protein n=1 Tax=Actinacidiphila yeochonensis TaxID=89050 RepID=UPI0005689157|nr:hypothetical protein [Actinacidiphila yeochonensis]